MKENMKNKFSIFKNNPGLVYLDSAATSQKPQEVIDAICNFYSNHNASVKRGIYDLSEEATKSYEKARQKVAKFINAESGEVAFTKGTTDSINLVAQGWADHNISADSEIVVTELEHHSNFVPWQKLVERKGAKLVVVPVSAEGKISASDFKNYISPKTSLVAVTQASNVLNIELDVKAITELAHSVGAKVVVDAAQSVAHKKVDVKDLGCDFLAFSAHKMFGPTGIGALFVKQELLSEVQPVQFGGGMVFEVGVEGTSPLQTIHKLEAGTPAVAQAIGFGAAVDFMEKNIIFSELKKHEATLCKTLLEGLSAIKGIKILGANSYKNGSGYLVSFVVENVHAHDVAAYLNTHKVCVRAGHHCAQPLHKKLGLSSSVRVSFSAYNDLADVQAILSALNQLEI